jgi:alkanesulfonate monooxygenase SsuD/methylene tetrahydromethanopterin reductase-like flavin-dependent oxidoreductase (luciferase family)
MNRLHRRLHRRSVSAELDDKDHDLMRLGLGLPHLGPFASTDAIRSVAIAAEAAGIDSLWAMDRLLSPVTPRTFAYPGRSDGTLPAAQQAVIDPLVALTLAATVTETITVGKCL